MRVTDLTVEVRSVALGRLGLIDMGYITDAKFIKNFNSVGSWTMSLPAEYDMAQMLAQKGRGIVVTGPANRVMISGGVLNWVRTDSGSDPQGTIAYTGVDDMVYLSDPLCYPDPAHSAELQDTDYDTRSGVAEDLMDAYLSDNVGPTATAARKQSFISIATNLHRGPAVSANPRFDQMGLVLSQIAAAAGMGFDMYQVGNSIQFSPYVPSDKSKSIRMDVANQKIDTAKYGFGAPTGTRFVVAGQGDGVDRQFITVTDSTATAEEVAWGRRIEVFKDRRDTNDPAVLLQEGTDDLAANGRTITSLAVTPSDDQTMVYGVDWFLGDIVGVVIDGQELSATVTQSIISITAAGVKTGAIIGTPTGFDYQSQLQQKVSDNTAAIAQLQKNVGAGIVYSEDEVDQIISGLRLTGVVSPSWANGLAPVLLDAGQVASGTVNAAIATSQPVLPGDHVILDSFGGNYYISTVFALKPKFLPQIPLTLQNGFLLLSDKPGNDLSASYGDSALHQVSGSAGNIYASMTSTGIVKVQGMVCTSSTPAQGTIIATLPAGFAPARAQIFAASGNNAYCSVYIDVAGNIRFLSGTTNVWLTLGRIVFRAAGYGTFTPLTLLNSWVEYTSGFGSGDPGGAGTHTPGYSIDVDGVVIFEGTMKSGSTAANVQIAQATGLAAQLTTNCLVAASGSTGGSYLKFGGSAGSGTGNYLCGGSAGTISATWTSLAGHIVMPSSTTSTWVAPTFQNSATAYSASYAQPSITKTPDGLVITQGLVSVNAVNDASYFWMLSKGWLPRYEEILATLSNAAIAQMNVGLANSGNQLLRDQVSLRTGSTLWASLDGLAWAAYA